ncbi:hypothetical protein KKI24_04825 [bacterium]|nr:hypothetical protein [bacterium]
MFTSLSQIEMLSGALIVLILLFFAYKIGGILATKRGNREIANLEKESHSSNKSLKRILEEEKNEVVAENADLKSANYILTEKLEDYRKKLAGMGMLSFAGNKRRSDILYSLLLENEALEQLVAEQGEKMADDRKDFLMHRMKDIRKRQRLLAEIFNDDTIKNYVQDVLSDEKKIEAATHRIESESDDSPQIEADDVKKLSTTKS